MKKLLACALILSIISSTGAMCFAKENVESSSVAVETLEGTLDSIDVSENEKEELKKDLSSLNDAKLNSAEKQSIAVRIKNFFTKHWKAIAALGTVAITVIIASIVAILNRNNNTEEVIENQDSEDKTVNNDDIADETKESVEVQENKESEDTTVNNGNIFGEFKESVNFQENKYSEDTTVNNGNIFGEFKESINFQENKDSKDTTADPFSSFNQKTLKNQSEQSETVQAEENKQAWIIDNKNADMNLVKDIIVPFEEWYLEKNHKIALKVQRKIIILPELPITQDMHEGIICSSRHFHFRLHFAHRNYRREGNDLIYYFHEKDLNKEYRESVRHPKGSSFNFRYDDFKNNDIVCQRDIYYENGEKKERGYGFTDPITGERGDFILRKVPDDVPFPANSN